MNVCETQEERKKIVNTEVLVRKGIKKKGIKPQDDNVTIPQKKKKKIET